MFNSEQVEATKTEIVQTTGDSETAVMSQKSVTEELNAIKTALEEIIAIQNTLMGGAE